MLRRFAGVTIFCTLAIGKLKSMFQTFLTQIVCFHGFDAFLEVYNNGAFIAEVSAGIRRILSSVEFSVSGLTSRHAVADEARH